MPHEQPAPPAGGRRAQDTIMAVAVAALAAFAVSLLVRLFIPFQWVPLDFWLPTLIFVLAAAACFCVRGPGATPWRLIAVGMLLFTSADESIQYTFGDGQAPSPSFGDALYLSWYPLLYLAVFLIIRARARRFLASMWLDGLVAGLGAAALADALVMDRLLAMTGERLSVVAVNLAYPVADLLLMTMVVGGCAALGLRLGRSLWLLLAGLAVFTVGDIVYLFEHGTGSLNNLTWPAAVVLIGLASLRSEEVVAARDRGGRSVAALPAAFAVASLGLLVWDRFDRLPTVAALLGVGCLAAATARILITVDDLRVLATARREARTDELTGLPNRRRLFEALDQALESASAVGSGQVALLMLDLDRFKEVNDALGHVAGDQLLAQVAPRLAATVAEHAGEAGMVGRLGGDEFAVLLRGPGVGDHPAGRGDSPLMIETAFAVASAITRGLAEPFALDSVTLHVATSIGIAMSPSHATDRDGLVRAADVAMYEAKSTGTGTAIYDAGRDINSIVRLQTADHLRVALEEGQLRVHFQPQVDLKNRNVTGFEALVRWQHPSRGLLAPDVFLPLAERTGMMRGLTMVVLDLALTEASRWWQSGLRAPVSVNLSASNLMDVAIVESVLDALHRHRLPHQALVLEITENILITDLARSRGITQELRRCGVQVSVDDYGTGYSSLAYLRDLSVDELKLDRAFISHLPADATGMAIVRHTIDLGHALGLRIVAEGIESEGTADLLEEFGCDVGQGFHFARPMPATAAIDWLAAHRSPGPGPRPFLSPTAGD
jgi:diguanylate cyclase (GGDEF)-like protein